jgi:hypothetical protein
LEPLKPDDARSKATRELADVDEVFHALAHSSRRHVLLILHFRGGRMTAGEIAYRLPARGRRPGITCGSSKLAGS